MRHLLLLAVLALPVAGCQSMRNAAGAYSRFAEKGITVGTPPADSAEPAKPALPGGLAGDGKTHAYAEPRPRSS